MRSRRLAALAALAVFSTARPAGAQDRRATLRILEAPSWELKLRSAQPGVVRRLHVLETAGVPIPALRVEVHLGGPDGAPIPISRCTIARRVCGADSKPLECPVIQSSCGETISLQALQSAEIELAITTQQLGAYRGSLVLIHEKPEVASIELARELAGETVELRLPKATAGSGGAATIGGTLVEKAGVQRDHLAPKLFAVSCKAGDAEVFTAASAAPPPPLSLDPYTEASFSMRLKHLPAAGECDAEIVVPLEGGGAARKTIKLLLRRTPWLGVALVALGVGLSFVLRYLLVMRRNARSLQRRLLLAERWLSAIQAEWAPLDAREAEVVAALGDAIQRAYGDLHARLDEPGDEAAAAVVAIEKKVASLLVPWLRVRRARAPLRAVVEPARGEIDEPLDRAARALSSDERSAAVLDELVEALGGAGAKLSALVDEQLTKPLEVMKATLKEQLLDLPPEVVPRLLQRMDATTSALSKGDVAAAQAEYDALRADYARALAEALGGELSRGRPLGFSVEGWKALVALLDAEIGAIRREQDGARAIYLYEATYKGYLKRRIDALGEARRDLGDKVNDVGAFTEVRKKELSLLLDNCADELARAEEALSGSGDLAAAKGAYDLALKSCSTVAGALRDVGVAMSSAAEGEAAREAAPTGLLAALSLGAPPAPGRWVLPRLPDFDRRALRTELGVTCALFAVAVVSGVHALEVQSPIWGTPMDLFEAFLWGLGLHQISGAAFTGLAELRQIFEKR